MDNSGSARSGAASTGPASTGRASTSSASTGPASASSASIRPASASPISAGRAGGPAPVWRLRVRMDDHPGTLARVTIRLADLGCNILSLNVLPVPGGVVDEVVLHPAPGLSRARLIEAIDAEGCECAGITDADLHELVDPAAAALTATTRVVNDPAQRSEVLRAVLAADMVTLVPEGEANPGRTEGGHRVVLPAGNGTALVARRSWAPFVQLELARAESLLGLLSAVRANVSGAVAVTCDDGSAVVLRPGTPADSDAVLGLHTRCSMPTLFHRYHTGGMRTIPRRWLHRLLVPPRGVSVLAVCGREVVALGQLIPGTEPETAEISLLVEDSWQRKGLGTALLDRLATLAAAAGHREIVATCLPEQDAVRRTALRAGLTLTERPDDRDGLIRMTVATAAVPTEQAPGIQGGG